MDTITQRDQNGNLTYYRASTGFEEWHEYDERGNLTHSRNTAGEETWREYDEHGYLIHLRSSDGREWWYTYDTTGISRRYGKKYDQNLRFRHLPPNRRIND